MCTYYAIVCRWRCSFVLALSRVNLHTRWRVEWPPIKLIHDDGVVFCNIKFLLWWVTCSIQSMHQSRCMHIQTCNSECMMTIECVLLMHSSHHRSLLSLHLSVYMLCCVVWQLVAHAVTLAGNNSEMFRGFLIVARNNAGQRFGTYTPMADGQTACDVSYSYIHSAPLHAITYWVGGWVGVGWGRQHSFIHDSLLDRWWWLCVCCEFERIWVISQHGELNARGSPRSEDR